MIIISKITSDDLTELSALLEELSDEKSCIDLMTTNLRMILSDNHYTLLGAKVDNVLAGSLMGIICMDLVGKCRPFMVIENVIVSAKFRNQGIGKMLMSEIENIAHKADCYYTMFVSSSFRKDAHRFYESIGYSPDIVKGFKKFL